MLLVESCKAMWWGVKIDFEGSSAVQIKWVLLLSLFFHCLAWFLNSLNIVIGVSNGWLIGCFFFPFSDLIYWNLNHGYPLFEAYVNDYLQWRVQLSVIWIIHLVGSCHEWGYCMIISLMGCYWIFLIGDLLMNGGPKVLVMIGNEWEKGSTNQMGMTIFGT